MGKAKTAADPREERRAKLIAAMAKVHAKYGEASLRTGDKIAPIRRVPTGIFVLDVALGTYDGEAGIPKGRAVMLVGHESACKSLIASLAIAEFQRRDEDCILVDAEGDWDPSWGRKLGIKAEDLLVEPSESMEQSLDILAEMIRVIPSGLIVVDSFAMMAPKAEVEESFFDWQQGLGARLMNKGWRNFQAGMNTAGKLDGANGVGPTLICIQQWRVAIGQKKDGGRTISGGQAQRFAMSITVSLWHGNDIHLIPGRGAVKAKDIPYTDRLAYPVIGGLFHFDVLKNKTAPPKRYGEFVIYNCHATDPVTGEQFFPGQTNLEEQILQLAQYHGIVQRKGSWYSYGSESLGQGAAGVTKRLKEDAELLFTLRDAVIDAEVKRIEGSQHVEVEG